MGTRAYKDTVYRKAFTLVELLVVIAIIALLMAILVPAMGRVKRESRSVACRSRLNQWAKAFEMYTMNNDGYFQSGETGKIWTETLKPASKAGREPPRGGKFLAWGVFDSGYAVMGLEGVCGSYGMNGHVSNSGSGMVDPWGRDLKNNWRSIDAKGAYNIPLFLDCAWLGGLPESHDSAPPFDDVCELGAFGVNMQGFCINRHDGFINGLFVDLSARKIRLKELWKLKWHRAFDTDAAPRVWPQWLKDL